MTASSESSHTELRRPSQLTHYAVYAVLTVIVAIWLLLLCLNPHDDRRPTQRASTGRTALKRSSGSVSGARAPVLRAPHSAP